MKLRSGLIKSTVSFFSLKKGDFLDQYITCQLILPLLSHIQYGFEFWNKKTDNKITGQNACFA